MALGGGDGCAQPGPDAAVLFLAQLLGLPALAPQPVL
jgi:hypothetical protein